jgi:spore germination cell wall hydrolase CwlJ-like protein
MRTLVILVCLLITSLYFYSTINAKQINDWEGGVDDSYLPLEQYLEQKHNENTYPLQEYLENFNEQEKCLAEAIYFESRGEPFLGQVAVGVVIVGRVNSPKFPNNICDVVHQGRYWNGNPIKNKCSFSYYCDGKSETIYNEREHLKAMNAASLVLGGVVIENMEDVLYYHATYVKPNWALEMTFVFQIGKHKFYK